MIFYENKKFYKFLAIIFLILNYLVFLFKPYYFVTFDSEPDYLANSFHILSWGIPWGGHHPGTIIQYFYSEILKFAIFINLDIKFTIILLRINYFLIYLFLIYLSSKVLENSKKIFLKYFLSISVIIPVINFHFSHFGIELILFGFSVLIWSLFYNQVYYKKYDNKISLIAFLIGIAASIKLSSIVLIFIYFCILFFFTENSLKTKLYNIFKTSIISLIAFVIFTLPSIRYYPKLFNKIKRQFNLDFFDFNEIFVVVYFILIFSFVLLIATFYYHKKLSNLFLKNKNLIIITIIILLSIIIIFNLIENNFKIGFLNFYFSIPSILRNFLPLIPLYILFLFHKKIKISSFFIITFSLVNILLFYLQFYNKVSKVDLLINNLRNDKIVIFTDSTFNSKYYFLEFTKVRWGNNKITFPQNWKEEINLSLASNDIYKMWVSNIFQSKVKNIDYKEKIPEKNNFIDNLRKLFEIKEYENKFDLLSLKKPPHNSRLIFDHCYLFKKSKVIFDLNYSDKKNQIFYESTIEDIEKYCRVELLKKENLNNIIVYEFK